MAVSFSGCNPFPAEFSDLEIFKDTSLGRTSRHIAFFLSEVRARCSLDVLRNECRREKEKRDHRDPYP